MSKHELEPAEQKPVAWIIRHPRFCGKFTDDKEIAEHWENKEQGCTVPLHLQPQPAPDVSGLVDALECALETMENVDGANDCSRGIDAVEEALAAHQGRKIGND